MSFSRNKLRILEMDNHENFLRLRSSANREEVLQLIRYISSAPLPLFQIEIIRKDMTAIALEAEQEGLSLREKLGVEPKLFCDEVISSFDQQSSFERPFKFASNILQAFALYFTVTYILNGLPAVFGITLTDIVLFGVWIGLGQSLTLLIRNKVAISGSSLLKCAPYVFFMVLTLLLFAGLTHFGHAQRYLITGTGWMLVIAIDVLAVVLYLLWNNYCERSARKYGF